MCSSSLPSCSCVLYARSQLAEDVVAFPESIATGFVLLDCCIKLMYGKLKMLLPKKIQKIIRQQSRIYSFQILQAIVLLTESSGN